MDIYNYWDKCSRALAEKLLPWGLLFEFRILALADDEFVVQQKMKSVFSSEWISFLSFSEKEKALEYLKSIASAFETEVNRQNKYGDGKEVFHFREDKE